MSVIQLCDVSKVYRGQCQPVKAVDHISLDIELGSSVAIKGKSGSGKSTLLNILAGLLAPTEGKVIYSGKNIYDYSEKELCEFRTKNIGIVFQAFQLLDELTVYENISFPLYLQDSTCDKKEIMDLLRILEIEDKIDAYPDQLSGGQQQRVAIARAFISHPQIILADEPTGNLDEKTSNQIVDMFLKCKEIYGQTLVVITHDDEVAEKMERVVTLKDGKIVSDTRR